MAVAVAAVEVEVGVGVGVEIVEERQDLDLQQCRPSDMVQTHRLHLLPLAFEIPLVSYQMPSNRCRLPYIIR